MIWRLLRLIIGIVLILIADLFLAGFFGYLLIKNLDQ